jgi:hypothetical protein
VANRYKKRAENYKQRLIKYLRQNQVLFPLYLNYGSGIDAIKPERDAYTASIWLGDKNCCGSFKSYEDKYQGNNPICCE